MEIQNLCLLYMYIHSDIFKYYFWQKLIQLTIVLTNTKLHFFNSNIKKHDKIYLVIRSTSYRLLRIVFFYILY